MSNKRFVLNNNGDDDSCFDIIDTQKNEVYTFINEICALSDGYDIVNLLNSLSEENEQLNKKLDYFQKRTIDLREELDYAKDDSEEVSRLCRIISEDKTRIARLEEQRLRLEDVIEKQNDLIETLWELYTDDQKPKH